MQEFFSMETPWGRAQSHRNLHQGITCCSTASHGGLFVPPCFLHNFPASARRWAAKWSGSEQWWEEDACWAFVAVAFPEQFDAEALRHARSIVDDYGPRIVTYDEAGAVDLADTLKMLGSPTEGFAAAKLWEMLSGNSQAVCEPSRAKEIYERGGYRPFSGYPLARAA